MTIDSAKVALPKCKTKDNGGHNFSHCAKNKSITKHSPTYKDLTGLIGFGVHVSPSRIDEM